VIMEIAIGIGVYAIGLVSYAAAMMSVKAYGDGLSGYKRAIYQIPMWQDPVGITLGAVLWPATTLAWAFYGIGSIVSRRALKRGQSVRLLREQVAELEKELTRR
jgi:hypothetical protein